MANSSTDCTTNSNDANFERLRALFAAPQQDDPQHATQLVDALLQEAQRAGASDIHFHPTEPGMHLKWRIDGVLQPLGNLSSLPT